MPADSRSALDRVSTAIGAELSYNVATHDDGVDATGGESLMITGSMGSGKTTLLIQFSALASHVEGSYNKEAIKRQRIKGMPGARLIPETVIWRGRKYDHWTVFEEENWTRSFPNSRIHKPLMVHVHEGDDIRFLTHQKDKRYLDLEADATIRYYRTVKDAFSHLVPGGFNVIYEPIDYELSPQIVRNLFKQKLKADISLDVCPPIPAPSPLWWFEFFGHLLEAKQRRDYITIVLDECHQVFPANPPGDHWHLTAGFANQVIDFRRNNVSFFPATQDANLVDYRITDRMTHFVWLPGSKPVAKRSRIHKNLISCLTKGIYLIEKSNERFGRSDFDRIPKQPPVVMAEGLPTLL